MDFFWNLFFSLITGFASSAVVVLFFQNRDRKKYRLTRAHIIERFSTVLYGTLTIVRSASGIKFPQAKDRLGALKELESLLGRDNPEILLGKLLGLSQTKHQQIILQLSDLQATLSQLFSDSLAHKSLEDKVAGSIAEMQNWIDDVLMLYTVFPELINGTADSVLQMRWQCSMSNLVENTFAILNYIIEIKIASGDELRWGSRSIKS